MASTVRFIAVGLGLVFGLAFVIANPLRESPMWAVWASLAVALTSAAGAVFGYGLGRWAELAALCPVRVRAVAAPVVGLLGVGLVGALIGAVLMAVAGLGASGWSAVRGWGLPLITALGAVPAVGAMYGVRHAAVEGPEPSGTTGEQVALLIALRQLLQRLLVAVGSLVALSTLALGASLAAHQALPEGAGGAVLPPQSVLIFGGAGSLLVALVYGPASTALQTRGRRLCEELFPLRESNEAEVVLSRVGDRHKLEQFLGVDRGVAADLQTGLVILGPLLASTAATFLP